MNTIKAPQTNIEAYLHNDLNIEIYEDLTEHEGWKGLFEPLEFFNMLYTEFDFFQTNVERYLEIKTHFGKLKLKETKRYYFLWALSQLINKAFPTDKHFQGVISKSCDFIEGLYNEINWKLYPKDENENAASESRYNFNKVEKHLETLPDNKAKIKYLVEIKTEYKINKNGWEFEIGTPFDKKCEHKIKALEKLSHLEATQSNLVQNSAVNTQPESIQKIDWKKEERLIPFLIHLLNEKGFLNEKNQFAFIEKHFTVNGKPVKRESIKANYNLADYLNKPHKKTPKEIKELTDIVERLNDILNTIE